MNTVAIEDRQPAPYVEYLRRLWGIKNGAASRDMVVGDPVSTDIYDTAGRKPAKARPRSDWPY